MMKEKILVCLECKKRFKVFKSLKLAFFNNCSTHDKVKFKIMSRSSS